MLRTTHRTRLPMKLKQTVDPGSHFKRYGNETRLKAKKLKADRYEKMDSDNNGNDDGALSGCVFGRR